MKHLNKAILTAEQTRRWEGLGRCICVGEKFFLGHTTHHTQEEKKRMQLKETESKILLVCVHACVKERNR